MSGFTPNEGQQTRFLASPATQCFYGGLPGGGKSHAGVIDALGLSHDPPQFIHPIYKAVLFRREERQLGQLIMYANQHYPALGLKSREGGKIWSLGGIDKIYLSHMHEKHSYLLWQGHEITYALYDELPQFEMDQWGNLTPWIRAPKGSGLTTYHRATGNPIGPGVPWVRDMFILPLEPNKIHRIRHEFEGKEYIRTRQFIPSSFRDNQHISEEYVGGLLDIPNPQIRKAFTSSDPVAAWSIVMGSFFEQFSNVTHVVPRSEEQGIREYLKETMASRVEGMDWGTRNPTAWLWGQEDSEGDVYITDEHYVAQQRLEYHARAVHDKRQALGWEDGNGMARCPFLTVGDPSIWAQSTTVLQSDQTIGAEFGKRDIYIHKANNDIIQGLRVVHDLLMTDGIVPPRLHIFESCFNVVNEMVAAITDERNAERIREGCSDHLIDALRYMVMYLREAPMMKTVQKNPSRTWDNVFGPEEPEESKIYGWAS